LGGDNDDNDGKDDVADSDGDGDDGKDSNDGTAAKSVAGAAGNSPRRALGRGHRDTPHSSKPATGKRVITNGKKGTIAFIGETEFSTGEWIGIVVRAGERGRMRGRDSEGVWACV